jgi:hypothetical protein
MCTTTTHLADSILLQLIRICTNRLQLISSAAGAYSG